MSNYIQLLFDGVDTGTQELIMAELSEEGFEGFEQSENSLTAFISEPGFNEMAVQQIAGGFGLTYSTTFIAEQNWNEVWESNFEPVTVEDFVSVRAHFHPPATQVEHEIVITPKMSFGTGHHATTYMMIKQMRSLTFTNKIVFDFGTGTGILAILAEKLGCTNITAIDNDDWSIENAAENIERNSSKNIQLVKADTAAVSQQFDIILANINKNVILENLLVLAGQIKPEGSLLLSGLLAEDENDILDATAALSLHHLNTMHKSQWISLLFSN